MLFVKDAPFRGSTSGVLLDASTDKYRLLAIVSVLHVFARKLSNVWIGLLLQYRLGSIRRSGKPNHRKIYLRIISQLRALQITLTHDKNEMLRSPIFIIFSVSPHRWL